MIFFQICKMVHHHSPSTSGRILFIVSILCKSKLECVFLTGSVCCGSGFIGHCVTAWFFVKKFKLVAIFLGVGSKM